ncbi:MAG: DUF4349 domain-containing protein [Ruminococcus sp.]|nr:DUF4349 domain-containing protein [Ruminococcus sp.]
MKRKLSAAIAVLLSAMMLAGCSAAPPDARSAAAGDIVYETTAAYYGDNSFNGVAAMAAAPAAGRGTSEAQELKTAEESTADIIRKIIRNAEINIKTLDADKSYAAVSAKISELGGYIYTFSTRSNEFTKEMNITYKLPPENLQAFCDWTAENENVSSSNVSADDITTAYYDSKTRLETSRRSLENYYKYLEEASDADEMLLILERIDRLTAEIESYEGQIRVWDALTGESEIYVYIQQTEDPTRAELEEIKWDQLSWGNVGTLMSNGIRNVLYGLLAVFQWLLITIVTLSPILLLAAIVITIIILYRKKHPKKPRNKKTAQENSITAEDTDNSENTPQTAENTVKKGYQPPPKE